MVAVGPNVTLGAFAVGSVGLCFTLTTGTAAGVAAGGGGGTAADFLGTSADAVGTTSTSLLGGGTGGGVAGFTESLGGIPVNPDEVESEWNSA